MAGSPTQRSLALLRRQGYLVQVVEHWNPFAKVRVDLFGVVDILALGVNPVTNESETLAIQTTSASNLSARVKKIRASSALPKLLAAGWRVTVHGWKKLPNGRYELREVEIGHA